MNSKGSFSKKFRKIKIKLINQLSLRDQDDFLKLSDINELSSKEIQEIKEMYTFFICNISNSVFTISLESAYCIAALIKKTKPTYIWDLGSGFTTWICSYITKSANINSNVLTIETNKEWGETIKTFIQTQNFSINYHIVECNELESFLFTQNMPELIIHDIGDKNNFSIRQNLLPYLGKICSKGALLFIDDLHKPEINSATRNTISKYNLHIQDLSNFTCDEFGRYAWLLIPTNYAS